MSPASVPAVPPNATRCVVIADDITGASTVGALLLQNQCSVLALMNPVSVLDAMHSGCDCLVYSTHSRHMATEKSYRVVYESARLLRAPGVRLYAKRIDPALYGSIGAETQAFLDVLGESERLAVVVPAMPALKRSVVGGYLLDDGIPQHKTLEAQQNAAPEAPPRSDRAEELFRENFAYPVTSLSLNELWQGPEALAAKFAELVRQKQRAVICDATSPEDLELIAAGLLRSGIKFLAVDPGPFTAVLARLMLRGESPAAQESSKLEIFGAVGGNNPLTCVQLEHLRRCEPLTMVTVYHQELISTAARRAAEISRAVNLITAAAQTERTVFAVCDHLLGLMHTRLSTAPLTQRCLEPEAVELIASAYGEIAWQVRGRCPSLKGMYTHGPEFTAAFCRELKSAGLRILGQIGPLSACAELLDGPCKGLKFAIAAATVGGENELTLCVHYLKSQLAR